MSDFLHQLFSLEGRVAIVTGGSRGIGAAIAQGFAKAGARVTALARTAQKPASLGAEVTYRQCDITADGAFERLAEQSFAQEKRLDILVNAAGISVPSGELAEAERFARTLDVNLRAVHRVSVAAAAHMKSSGGGAIINVTSINSVLGFPGNPGYVASKGGLRMLTKALAMDLAAAKVRVNAIAPGYIRTAMTAASHADTGLREARLERMIIRRFGEPEDVVGAAIFLASPAASYITGIDLFVDGGWTAKGL
jgi:NAD(P)-dependent dehydrogenase (short-subunit alcohol dehydrogenase family)